MWLKKSEPDTDNRSYIFTISFTLRMLQSIIMRLPLLLVFLILSIISGAQKNKIAYKSERGVSEDLAAHRKQVLSGIDYTLKLQIPETIQHPVMGDEIISVFV